MYVHNMLFLYALSHMYTHITKHELAHQHTAYDTSFFFFFDGAELTRLFSPSLCKTVSLLLFLFSEYVFIVITARTCTHTDNTHTDIRTQTHLDVFVLFFYC